jgi:uncharacterized protein (DUF342 family)
LEAKLGYIAGQQRVKVELTRQICLHSDAPPAELFQRAVAKLESVKKTGQIVNFEVYEDSVKKAWKKLREDTSIPEYQVVSMTLAQGLPKLAGFEFVPSANAKAAFDITISAPAREVAKWYHGWLVFALNRELQKQGKSDTVNSSQIKGAMMRAITGQKIAALPISTVQSEIKPSAPGEVDKAYAIVANRARKEIAFVVKDMRAFLAKINEPALVKLVNIAANKMREQSGDDYKVLDDEITSQLRTLASGPEILGIDLPAVILGAIGVDAIAQPKEIPAANNKTLTAAFDIRVSDNRLTATVTNFSMDQYDNPDNTFDKLWFRQQLKRLRIPEKTSAAHLDSLVQSAAKQVDLSGMICAQGKGAIDGAGPYLHESYLDRNTSASELESAVLDIRGLQQRSLVSTGDLIAEVRFKEEAKAGFDVYGEIIYPNPPAEIDVQVGEGIQRKDGGRYYATYVGVPTIEKNCISLSKILIHKGDVNLRSGDIVFDGPVEITGSVDTGASIVATGDITIIGSVRGGKVKAGGSISVTGGVVTGTTGYLEAKASIAAEFIENSRVHCGGTLRARKSILNCEIICGENVEILDQTEGILAGGSVSCKQDVMAANIGFKRGALTTLRVGVDWKIEKTVKIQTNRLKNVTDCQERDRLELREIVSKNRAQMTKKHDDKKKILQERLTQARTIMGKLQQKLDFYKAKLSFNMTSIVLVEGIMFNNVEVHIGGGKVSPPNDLAGIGLVAKKKRGTHIVPIDEARATKEPVAS